MRINFRFNYGWSPSPVIHFAIVLIMCFSSGLISLFSFKMAHDDLAKSSIVKGVVVESKISASGMHTPVVEYETADGKMSQFLAVFSTKPQKYFEGEIVEVIISKDAEKPKVKNFFTIYGISAFAAVFSFISLIGAIGIYFMRVRQAD
jgi:hypothetical protein